jgi:predicted ABC-type ATPase
VIALAGPNGAGKSTVGSGLLRGALQVSEFVNADVIAQGLSAFNPEAVAIAAGRAMRARLRELAGRRADFAFETTLAGRAQATWIRGGRPFRPRADGPAAVYRWTPQLLPAIQTFGHHLAALR